MKPVHDTPPIIPHNCEIPYEDDQPLYKNYILLTLKHLQKDKAPGLSQIPISYYYWGGGAMADMLLQWYRTIEQYGIVPWNMNIDIKTPFPKYDTTATEETKQDPTKYRPIALQNSIYKILDGCIKIVLEKHNEEHNIIASNQGGFKQKEGTIEHLFVIQNLFHHNNTLYCGFLDLQKAYDTV